MGWTRRCRRDRVRVSGVSWGKRVDGFHWSGVLVPVETDEDSRGVQGFVPVPRGREVGTVCPGPDVCVHQGSRQGSPSNVPWD